MLMRERLISHSKLNLNKFQRAEPFPHIVIDDFLEIEYAKSLASQLTYSKLKINNWENWYNDAHSQNVKRHRLEDEFFMSKEVREFARYMNSRDFVLFLESLTEYKHLIGDPYFTGGGVMVTEKGGLLDMHLDFNWNHKLQLWRKVNAIIYLTENWQDNWGGDLILESKSTGKSKSIKPYFNRLIIFRTDGESYHGQPNPLNCPENICRSVLSNFYYSKDKLETTSEDPHFTKYKIEKNPRARNLKLTNY